MIRVGINGFGRIGRLALRAAHAATDMSFVRINDPAADAATLAHLLAFDSVHGRLEADVRSDGDDIVINGHAISCTRNRLIEETDWSDCDLVIEASGVMRDREKLQRYLDQGVQYVVVTAPMTGDDIANIVMGVNQDTYDPTQHAIVTAASCTTNCIAPAVKVVHEQFGIVHGSITTIHDVTNTQVILDAPHKDLRRARASSISLIPTTTGSARAITQIFPDLVGRLDGHAVRVPLANASLTDCVFELEQDVTAEDVNSALSAAASGPLQGILGYETRPLVSVDFRTDPRSSIVDALSTLVVNKRQLKLYLWYDNEWGYANRTVELARWVPTVSA